MTRLMITIEDLYSIYLAHPVVSTDTRQLPEGCIFFALRGARFDGNQYARAALEAGAAYAIIDDPSAQIDERTILVEDSLKALTAARLPPPSAAGHPCHRDHWDEW